MPADLLFADSGPLIALARLDLCHLPQRYFSEVQVPQTVWDEVTRQPRGNESAVFSAAVQAGWFTIVADPAEASAPVRAYALDAGEAAASRWPCRAVARFWRMNAKREMQRLILVLR